MPSSAHEVTHHLLSAGPLYSEAIAWRSPGPPGGSVYPHQVSSNRPCAPGSSSSSAPIVRDSQSLLDNMNRVLCSYRA
jgi:hypothetical protein